MNKNLFGMTLVLALASFAAAQDSRTPPTATLRANAKAISSRPAMAPGRSPFYPPFCPQSTCLYYAGDYDSNFSGDNGLFNSDDTGFDEEGQAWVGVRPNRAVTLTGATFVEELSTGYAGTNPIAFVVQEGITSGQPGKTVCSTHGNSTITIYGGSQELPNYAYTIKKLAKSCRLEKNQVYYVNLLPASGNGFGYLVNLPPSPQNHHGWKNDLNDCYFNSSTFDADYVTCDSQGAFSELSIALTGK